MAELVLLMGIPASGKSTLSREYREKGYTILSSDEIRQKLLDGEAYPQNKEVLDPLNNTVFSLIKEQARETLLSGGNVLFDATNLNRKRRRGFLSFFSNIPCHKKCILVLAPREVCLERNSKRDALCRVPDDVMEDTFKRFECPVYAEGWDEIVPFVSSEEYKFPFEMTKGFSQDNPHHTLDLFGHMESAKNFAIENGYSKRLVRLAFYHDIGKFYTKTFFTYKGEPCETAHFYGHENYSAFLYITEMCCGKELSKEEFDEILYDTALIGAHMRPLNAWLGSEKAKERDIEFYGENFIHDLELLNKADASAH